MPWIVEQAQAIAILDDFTHVHNHDGIAHVLHHAKIVGDEHIGQFQVLLQLA